MVWRKQQEVLENHTLQKVPEILAACSPPGVTCPFSHEWCFHRTPKVPPEPGLEGSDRTLGLGMAWGTSLHTSTFHLGVLTRIFLLLSCILAPLCQQGTQEGPPCQNPSALPPHLLWAEPCLTLSSSYPFSRRTRGAITTRVALLGKRKT